MFVAHFENTMRHAKFAEPKEKPVVVNILVERRKRVVVPKPLSVRQQVMLQDERDRANASINAANLILAKLHENVSSFSLIIQRISRVTGIKAIDILSDRRSQPIVFARQAVMYWCCRRTLLSLSQIGLHLNRDHTTIIAAKRAYVKKRARMGRTLRPLDQRQGNPRT